MDKGIANYTAFRGNGLTFHGNQIVLAFRTGYNKILICVSGKSLSVAADDIMSISEKNVLEHSASGK